MSESEKQATPCGDCPRWMRESNTEVSVQSSGALLFDFEGGVFYGAISPDSHNFATGYKSADALETDCPELAKAIMGCPGPMIKKTIRKWLFGLVTLSEQEQLICPAIETTFAGISVYEYFDKRSGIINGD